MAGCNGTSRNTINPTPQNTTINMTNNQTKGAARKSIAPEHALNLRSRGNELMDLPEAAQSTDLLEPKSRRVRVTLADGSFNNNVAYLSLTPQSQAERRTLVSNISNYLGPNMKAWHAALHRPKKLPENALDWSTVRLQRTYDLVRVTPGGKTVTEWLTGVFQAMNTTSPDPETSDRVQAAIDSSQAMATPSSSSPSTSSNIAASRSVEIKQLQDQVKRLQELVQERELEVSIWEGMLVDDDDDDDDDGKTGLEQTIPGTEDEIVFKTETMASTDKASSSFGSQNVASQHDLRIAREDEACRQPGADPDAAKKLEEKRFKEDDLARKAAYEEEVCKQAWADHDAIREDFEKTKRELDAKRSKMDDLLSCAGSDQGDNKASNSLPSPPRSV
jgi:hypothetical protein